MSIFNNNLNAFGLDLSDRSIKVAQLKRNEEKIYLSAYGRENVPEGLIKDGEIKDAEAVASLIKKALADSRPSPIKSKFVVYSIPEPKGFIRVVDIPYVGESNIEDTVRYEAEQLFPIDISESYLDWQILSRNSDTLKILVAAVPKQLVDSYSLVLKSAGLVPIAAEIESIAITRSLINEKQSSRPILIIDLGKDRTSFIIFKSPAVQFTASIPVCGKEFNKAIAKEFGVDEEKAEKIKESCGLSLKSECRRVYRAIQPSLHEMIRYIDKLTDYYRGHYKSESDIAKVIICGGEARIIGISSFLSLRIKKEIERANPWINIIP
jgi:type IV pilus assembly protein PilM